MLFDVEHEATQHAIPYSREDKHTLLNGECRWENRPRRVDRLVPMLLLRERRRDSRLRGRVGRRVVFVGRELVPRGLHCLRRRKQRFARECGGCQKVLDGVQHLRLLE